MDFLVLQNSAILSNTESALVLFISLQAVVSQINFINMGYMFGMVIGSFIFGIISDKLGNWIFSALIEFTLIKTALIEDYLYL